MTADHAPLILTLEFDRAALDVLDGLRRSHFPARLNFIPAHLTLFHALPGKRFNEVAASVRRVSEASTSFPVLFTGLRKLGRGTALTGVASEINAVRAPIAAEFSDALTAQDRQSPQPHVTIQNKVDPKEAAALYDRLAKTFEPWKAMAVGLLLWRYRDGPWEAAGRFPFRPSTRTSG